MRRRLVLQALRPNAAKMPIFLERFRTPTFNVFSPISAHAPRWQNARRTDRATISRRADVKNRVHTRGPDGAVFELSRRRATAVLLLVQEQRDDTTQRRRAATGLRFSSAGTGGWAALTALHCARTACDALHKSARKM